MTFSLTILGCNGSGPAPDGPASGYLVRTAKTSIWLDAGTGTFMELTKHLDPAEIDGLVITHIHADHSADVFGLVHYLAYRVRRPMKIPFFAPRGAADSCGARFETTFRFESAGDKTNVNMSMNTRAVTLFAKLMSPLSFLMADKIKKCIQSDIDQMSKICEQV